MNALTAIARLIASPAYRRCSVDLYSVCKRMERLTLAKYSREERENAARYAGAARYADAKAYETTKDNAARENRTRPASIETNSVILTQFREATMKAEKQEAFPTIETKHHETLGVEVSKTHENIPSRFAFDEVYTMAKLRQRPTNGKAAQTEKTPKDACKQCQEERAAIREERAAKNVGAHTCYADAGKKTKNGKGEYRPTGAAACEKLFLVGEKEEDGFSRTIALRYLQKRMVFSPKTNTKSVKTQDGAAVLPKTLKARKTSSSRHNVAFYLACDIEDTIQEAFTLYTLASLTLAGREHWTEKQAAQMAALTASELKTVETLARNRDGNRLHDTCAACQRAKNLLTRARHAEKKRLAVIDPITGKKTTFGIRAAMLAARMEREQHNAVNATYDDEVEEYLEAARVHGYSDQKTLASVLGISTGELSKRLGRLRERLERAERIERQKADATRLERFRDWETCIAARNWEAARACETPLDAAREYSRPVDAHSPLPIPSVTLEKYRPFVRA